MAVLALKLLLAPGFVVAASLVARRFGVRIGGVVGGLPAIAGPILFVLTLQHGRSFAAHAAEGTLLGMVALAAFILAYVAVSRHLSWPWAVGLGWLAFGAVVAALSPVRLGPLLAFVAACGAGAVTLALLPRPRAADVPPVQPPRWDLPLRAASAVVPVVAVTAASHALGSHLSGLLASFPVITPVLAAFTHAQGGAAQAARLLHGMTVGFFAYAVFCLTIGLALVDLRTAPAFALATCAALAAQGVTVALTRRREQLAASEALA